MGVTVSRIFELIYDLQLRHAHHVTYTIITFSYTFPFLVQYLQWENTQPALKMRYVQTAIVTIHIFHILLLLILNVVLGLVCTNDPDS